MLPNMVKEQKNIICVANTRNLAHDLVHLNQEHISLWFQGIHLGQHNVSWVISLGPLIATNMAATQSDDRISLIKSCYLASYLDNIFVEILWG